jgi:hypothetical protein
MCPYFFPTEPHDADLWRQRRLLPLSDGFRGRCTAGDFEPEDELLWDGCNLGYARQCPHLPKAREADAVRFCLTHGDGRIQVAYVCERDHRPGESGVLKYDPSRKAWDALHPNRCLQRMAECLVKGSGISMGEVP